MAQALCIQAVLSVCRIFALSTPLIARLAVSLELMWPDMVSLHHLNFILRPLGSASAGAACNHPRPSGARESCVKMCLEFVRFLGREEPRWARASCFTASLISDLQTPCLLAYQAC